MQKARATYLMGAFLNICNEFYVEKAATLAFLPSLFAAWPKKSGQKFEYLKYEKRIFHYFERDFTEANKTNFFERWESDFKKCI